MDNTVLTRSSGPLGGNAKYVKVKMAFSSV